MKIHVAATHKIFAIHTVICYEVGWNYQWEIFFFLNTCTYKLYSYQFIMIKCHQYLIKKGVHVFCVTINLTLNDGESWKQIHCQTTLN